jgi:hypothetical protein
LIKWAIELLNTRAADIDPVEALAVIPPNIPIREISQFLQQVTHTICILKHCLGNTTHSSTISKSKGIIKHF